MIVSNSWEAYRWDLSLLKPIMYNPALMHVKNVIRPVWNVLIYVWKKVFFLPERIVSTCWPAVL
jgi:hypothetical protein